MRTGPGMISLTAMWSPRTSCARIRTNIETAAFADAYADHPGPARRPAPDPITRIFPPPSARSNGIAACAHRYTPSTFSAKVPRQLSSDPSSTGSFVEVAAGVGDQHIEAAALGLNAREQVGHGVGLGDVRRHGQGVAARGLDGLGDGLDLGDRTGGEDDPGPGRAVRLGNGPPDAPSGTGYHRRAVGQGMGKKGHRAQP